MAITSFVSQALFPPSLSSPNRHKEKLLGQVQGEERERLVELIKPQLFALKKYNFGKQIAAIEKLIFTGPITQTSYAPLGSGMIPSSATTNTTPSKANSVAATPSLTTETNSPQSSFTPPSTNASVVDGPTTGRSDKADSSITNIEAV